ncbi:MAG: amino acid ABC transporter permease [Acidimicrobiales bacterium]
MKRSDTDDSMENLMDEPPSDRTPSGLTGRFAAEDGARGALIATISTIVVFGAFIVWVLTSPNWPRVRDQFFNPEDFRASAPTVARGFWLNLRMFAVAVVAIPVVAVLIAFMRSLRGPAFAPARLFATAYTDFFRGIPVILLVLVLGFGVPALDLPGLTNSAVVWGVTALTLSYAAYTAEIYRSGIEAVPESQRASARALGLTQIQTLRYAILPQAVRNVVPALMNLVVALLKDVALVSVLGVRDAVKEADIYKARTFNYTSFLVAAALFLAVSIPLTRFVDWYAARDRAMRSQTAV